MKRFVVIESHQSSIIQVTGKQLYQASLLSSLKTKLNNIANESDGKWGNVGKMPNPEELPKCPEQEKKT